VHKIFHVSFIYLLYVLRPSFNAQCVQVALPIMSKYTARTSGSFIKLAHSSVGWSYFSCDPEFGSLNAKYLVVELERALAAYDVRFVNLKGIVEVIPRRLNKGIIVKKILRDVATRDGNAGVDFILCMGDDVSDEKMFTVSRTLGVTYHFCFVLNNPPSPSPKHFFFPSKRCI
jgi:trehalose 6-phosphate synthase/phosphatase